MGLNDKHPILSRLQKNKSSGDLTELIHLMKELPGLDAVMGCEYEVKDRDGEIIFTITKKALNFTQLNILLNEEQKYQKIQAEQSKKASKKK